MADTTPQLKRKREGATGPQKKAKKQRKSDALASAGQDEAVAATVAQAAQTPTKKSVHKARPNGVAVGVPASSTTPQATSTAGVRDTLVTPSHTSAKKKSGNKDKAEAQAKEAGSSDERVGLVHVAKTKPPPESRPSTQTPDARGTPSHTSVETTQIKKDRSEAKKERRAERQAQKASTSTGAHGPLDTAETQTTQSASNQAVQDKTGKKKARKEGKTLTTALGQQPTSLTKSKKHRNKSRTTWTVSPAHGGWFLPKDPIFSSDEKHIILAIPRAIHIYTAESSLLARALPITSTDAFVTAFALSATKPNQLYVADSSQLITLWDWVQGSKLGRWQVGAVVKHMVVITKPGSDEDLVYCHEGGKSHIINVHALRTKQQASETELKQVLQQDVRIERLQVLLQGKYIIVTCAHSVIIGKRLRVSKTAVQDFEYVWREISFSSTITTSDAYYRPPILSENGKKTSTGDREILDLAVGDGTGAIFLFEDLLASFAATERFQKDQSATDSADAFRPKRLHWHRSAVGSVKWSLDGNYLISGGDETVLTIWQLATGKPQHLPHLTAAIENVVVSPAGSSYALTLANNSVIVLSTSELDAKTNIIGIQSRRLDPHQLKTSKNGFPPVYASVPIAVDPKNAHQVLCAVPSSQPRTGSAGVHPSPYLQTFDIANQRPVSRQALTRNNATDMNQAPDGKRILEPNVHLLQLSHDGQYLATVDEWMPPIEDLNYIDENESAALEAERLRRREVYLKIWRWNESKGLWGLETRINAPHFDEDTCSNEGVIDLVANPKEHGFATIGEDHVVRIWKPTTRTHHGVVFRGASNKGSINWSLYRLIKLPDPNKLWLSDASSAPSRNRTLRLAYSADGSILAAGVSGASDADRGLIHLVDANKATIRRSMTEIDTTVLCGLGIVGRYLVAITDCITVWDIVYDDLVYCAPVNTAGFSPVERMSVVRLAVNEADGTFAVSLPQLEKYKGSRSDVKKASSKILVYGTEESHPLCSNTVAGITLGLAARKGTGERGYIALDSVSCIRTISPAAGGVGLPVPRPAELKAQEVEEDVVAEERDDTAGRRLALDDVVLDDEYDKPVVTQQDLEKVFHTESAPQAPKDVFSALMRLFGGVVAAAA